MNKNAKLLGFGLCLSVGSLMGVEKEILPFTQYLESLLNIQEKFYGKAVSDFVKFEYNPNNESAFFNQAIETIKDLAGEGISFSEIARNRKVAGAFDFILNNTDRGKAAMKQLEEATSAFSATHEALDPRYFISPYERAVKFGREHVSGPLLGKFRQAGRWIGQQAQGYLPTGVTERAQQFGHWAGGYVPELAKTEGAKEALAVGAVVAPLAYAGETARRMYDDPTRKYTDDELKGIVSDVTKSEAEAALIRRGYYRVDPRRYTPFMPKFGIPSVYRAYRSRAPRYLGGYATPAG